MDVWIATFNNYVHGVFASEEDSEEYTERRWGAFVPYGWKIEKHAVGKGAFDPREEEEENDDV